ncbi:MAG: sugar kinase [Deltaproteobacteria bacterium]|nr:sugar kinase [Deltaproteobacteria bacterium]
MKAAGLGQCSLDYITLVNGFPVEDTKKEVLDFIVQGGGPVATALVALSRLGVKTSMIGRVSDDFAGVEIRKGLREEGVDTKEFFRGAGILLLDGLMMEASVRAASIASKMNIPILLDAGSLKPGMLSLAALCDYVVCSEGFASAMKMSLKDALVKLAGGRAKAVTVTLGRKGSVTLHDGRIFTHKACQVKAVDTTGAGDVFHGAYAFGVLQGWDMKKTVEFASIVAAMKCTKLGGRTGIPTLKEAMRFLKGKR